MGWRGRVALLGSRWLHLLQGGALFMPFFLLAAVGVSLVYPRTRPFGPPMSGQFTAYALALPIVALAGLLPLIRSLETAAVRTLCGVPASALAPGPAVSWAARRRTTVWFTLHAGLGALVSGASLAVPPMAIALLAFPLSPWLREHTRAWPWDHGGSALWTAPVAGLALLAALVTVVHGAGTVLARCAPVLLGPTPADRLAAAERRAAELAARNRVARELHDSVGHALSAASLQASAAQRVLDSDPDFVREALAAIEETTRGAVAELDTVLGALREDGPGDDGPREDSPRGAGPRGTGPHDPPHATAAGGTGPDTSAATGATATTGTNGTGGPTSTGSPDPAPDPAPSQGQGPDPQPDPGPGPGQDRAPTLGTGLAALLARCRATGTEVELYEGEGLGPLGLLPPGLSSAAFRIVQEGLSNALRHAPGAPVRAWLERQQAPENEELVITVENRVAPPEARARTRTQPRTAGGRGLSGVSERAALLGGTAHAHDRDGVWRLTARLPLTAAGR
ncbi:sensor histidine kinase [Streptomyces iconiensis]|uniref:histidine kinase n=1 Tax=Streptomyces iconiensis TaxID=1384038 RepID=A0ABT6ZW87_9ACTN|nr:sensor histidine kinase [Streptomyces iconiensis]MDJ1133092.1 histidine kinase [Streptomyces iconiensis]